MNPRLRRVIGWRRRGAVLIVSGTLLFALALATAFAVSAWKGLDYRCLVEGPRSALAEASEDSSVGGSFGFWPVGRDCEFRRADGAGTVVAHSDWNATVFLGASASLVVAGIVLSLRDRRSAASG